MKECHSYSPFQGLFLVTVIFGVNSVYVTNSLSSETNMRSVRQTATLLYSTTVDFKLNNQDVAEVQMFSSSAFLKSCLVFLFFPHIYIDALLFSDA